VSRRIAIAAALLALALPASASAWHATLQHLFRTHGSAIGGATAVAKKCGGGGKLGTYDYRSTVVASGQSFELVFEVTAKLSVRDSWRKLKQVAVEYTATDYPEDLAEQAAVALDDFHETVFTKYKADKNGPGGKLLVRHGELVISGNVVVESDEATTKFNPKPGC
jgi:hypothetical protein